MVYKFTLGKLCRKDILQNIIALLDLWLVYFGGVKCICFFAVCLGELNRVLSWLLFKLHKSG